ncbi:STAS domain-containing protein [Seonamhaeicola sediminis]|uniref:STAS domain-containing protein n=1 Tax=Seonamhaeicola sediminis TaxID=2528206 RepID=A0A562YEH2_9FLAO|nr:STAS domain-containing protein [Seonamhaeicola sediminis]TWO32716.1 STAS domain-containing protein [Seonamhaeicola sediminis]
MALKIKENNGTFFIEGSINASTVKQFKNHVEFLLLYTKGVTLNIDEVTEIDTNGMHALRDLYTVALIKNKSFYIIGNGCKEIFQDFESNLAA